MSGERALPETREPLRSEASPLSTTVRERVPNDAEVARHGRFAVTCDGACMDLDLLDRDQFSENMGGGLAPSPRLDVLREGNASG